MNMSDGQEHTLEFLLSFDGHVHWYAEGYFVKFEIRRVEPTTERPHGLRYSFTLHDPDGQRLIGFDNAHPVAVVGSRFSEQPAAADHWHRTENDEGRPYAFTTAATLIFDFFAEVGRVLTARGIPVDVVKTGETPRRSKR
jgi:hypothetical protein